MPKIMKNGIEYGGGGDESTLLLGISCTVSQDTSITTKKYGSTGGTIPDISNYKFIEAIMFQGSGANISARGYAKVAVSDITSSQPLIPSWTSVDASTHVVECHFPAIYFQSNTSISLAIYNITTSGNPNGNSYYLKLYGIK